MTALKKRNNVPEKIKGFTLIELMIVVAIIGILSAIAVPSFMTYRQRSYDKQCNSVIKNIASAQSMYNATNDRYTISSANLMTLDPNIPASSATGVSWGILAASATAFDATASHSLGTGLVYTADESAVVTIP